MWKYGQKRQRDSHSIGAQGGTVKILKVGRNNAKQTPPVQTRVAIRNIDYAQQISSLIIRFP